MPYSYIHKCYMYVTFIVNIYFIAMGDFSTVHPSQFALKPLLLPPKTCTDLESIYLSTDFTHKLTRMHTKNPIQKSVEYVYDLSKFISDKFYERFSFFLCKITTYTIDGICISYYNVWNMQKKKQKKRKERKFPTKIYL